MTIRDLLEEYLQGKLDAISLIRRISGAFDPDHAIDLLSLVCFITRVEQGDLDKDTFRKLWLKPKDPNDPA